MTIDPDDGLLKPIVRKSVDILTIDLERIPGQARVWSQKTNYIPVTNWTRYPTTLCFAAKWYGKRAIEFHAAWDDNGFEAMVKRAWDLYDQADIVITFNGKRADNKWLRQDWAMAGWVPPSPWKDLDLFTEAKSLFDFESKGLNYLCLRLGLPVKAGHYDPVVAEAALAGDARAQADMRRYNRQDVRITEQCADRIRPWLKNHPHVTVSTEPRCNRCGSANLQRIGDYAAVVRAYGAFRCLDCGGTLRNSNSKRVAYTTGIPL